MYSVTLEIHEVAPFLLRFPSLRHLRLNVKEPSPWLVSQLESPECTEADVARVTRIVFPSRLESLDWRFGGLSGPISQYHRLVYFVAMEKNIEWLRLPASLHTLKCSLLSGGSLEPLLSLPALTSLSLRVSRVAPMHASFGPTLHILSHRLRKFELHHHPNSSGMMDWIEHLADDSPTLEEVYLEPCDSAHAPAGIDADQLLALHRKVPNLRKLHAHTISENGWPHISRLFKSLHALELAELPWNETERDPDGPPLPSLSALKLTDSLEAGCESPFECVLQQWSTIDRIEITIDSDWSYLDAMRPACVRELILTFWEYSVSDVDVLSNLPSLERVELRRRLRRFQISKAEREDQVIFVEAACSALANLSNLTSAMFTVGARPWATGPIVWSCSCVARVSSHAHERRKEEA